MRALIASVIALIMVATGAVSAHADVSRSLSGTVYLESMSTPAADVRVEWTIVGQAHNPANFVTTDANGDYTITGLGSAMYYVYFDYTGSGGYADQWYRSGFSQSPWLSNPADGATAVDITGLTFQNLDDTRLQRPGSISGVISLGTSSVHPAPGEVLVSYRCETAPGVFGAWSSPVPSTTGGLYTLTGVGPSHRCRVFYDYQGSGSFLDRYYDADTESAASSVSVISLPISLHILIPVSTPVTGHVSLGSAAVAAGAGEVRVTAALSGSTTPIAGVTTTTDASGNYVLAGVPAAAVTLMFTYLGTGSYAGVTSAPLAQGARTKNATIAVGYPLSGHVSLETADTSAGAGQVRIGAWNSSGTEAQWTLTDADGNYRFPGVEPGSYYLKFEYLGAEDYPDWFLGANGDSRYAVEGSTPFSLQSALTGKDVVMGAGPAIEGRVTNTAGAPLSGEVVNAFGYRIGTASTTLPIRFTTTTLADGTYRLRALPDGYYYRVDFGGANGYARESWDDWSYSDLADAVVIEVGDVSVQSGVDAALERAGSISGAITVVGLGGYDCGSAYWQLRVYDWLTDTWVPIRGFRQLQGPTLSIPDLKPDFYRVVIECSYNDGGIVNIGRHVVSEVLQVTEGSTVNFSALIDFRSKSISQVYNATGGASGPLGAAVSGIGYYAGGSLQHFANGSIYSSDYYGTHIVWAGPIRDIYWASGSITGQYYWPMGDLDCSAGRCTQDFNGGTIAPDELYALDAPTVSGTPMVGATLTATSGSYYPDPATIKYAWLRDGSRIPGATTATYVPTAADAGRTIQVEVTAGITGWYPAIAVSTATAAVGPSAVSRIATLYSSLGGATGQLGVATSAAVAFPNNGGGALQHFTNGSIYSSHVAGTWVVWAGPIRDVYWGASSITGTYKWPSGDQICSAGTCTQTFTGGTIAASPLAVNVAPSISGPAQVGGTLVANPGTYNPVATSFRYAWLRNGVTIPGATTSTFALTAADLGKTLQVQVTASRTGSVSTVTLSVPTAAVAPSAAMQIAALYASLAGQLGAATTGVGSYPNGGGGSLQHFTNGSIYSSSSGTWVVWAGPIRDTYWGARSILGTYGWPTGAQDCSGGPCVQTFVGGSITAAPLQVTAAPTVTGPAQVGVALVANPGTYDLTGASFRYAWLRNGVRIAGATSASYVPVAADAGLTLRVEVTASKVGSVSVTTLSAPTGAVAPSAAMQIAALNASLGGQLGAATSGIGTYPNAGGGSLQHFTNGSIYSSAVSGTWVVWAGPIRDVYWAARSILGTYGWPTGAQDCSGGPCVQTFVGGSITASPLAVSVAPTVTGPAQVGVALVANPGTYSPAGASFRYAWVRPDGTRIAGATSASYVPIAADAGLTLRVEVTASKVGFVSVTTLSAPTAAVAPSAAMQIAALNASLGGQLGAATSGIGTYPNGGGGSLQHFTNGSIYSSTTSGTWVVWAGPIRDAYWAARSILGTYGWPTGAQDCSGGPCVQTFVGGSIAAAPLAVNVAPSVSGVAQVGATLVASPGTYAPAATSFRYAWLRNGTRISGATSSSYVPVAADAGLTLQVEVTASAVGSVSVATLSTPTAVIAPSAAMQIAALNASLPGQLGAATSGVGTYVISGGGSLQHFVNGSIYSSSAGTWVVWAGPIRDAYWAASSISGVYQWPTGAQTCVATICTQTFTGGTITR